MNLLRVGRIFAPLLLAVAICVPLRSARAQTKVFMAGASKVDVTPLAFPVIVNGMFEERSASEAHDPLHSRALVLDDGATRIAFVVVDTCMMPRDLIDEAKTLANAKTGIPTDRLMVSATHTHSAPAAMGCLGSRADPAYAKWLPGKIAESIVQAVANLQPARVGWGSVDSWDHTFCRRWIRRPDRLISDPFGVPNVRAHMHPGHESPDAIAPSGPVDPGLALLSVQDLEGKPLALLANYSMHYYESPLLSADYFGVFARETARLLGTDETRFVGIMSQGTSGDQMWMDYGAPRNQVGMEAYGRELAELAAEVVRSIQHQDWVPLGMNERKLNLNFRLPSADRLQWARELSAKIGDRLPRGLAEIYALEALHLQARPSAELVLQAIRVGELAIATFPNEVYALTGLKIKRRSPFGLSFNIELANGAEGYIPPPEQHRLGGYTTWPARTAGLETNAEPKIVATLLSQLEKLAQVPRKQIFPTHGAYARAVLADRPSVYLRLDEMEEGPAANAAGAPDATFIGNLAFFLPGPDGSGFSAGNPNHAIHLVAGGIESKVPHGGADYSLELWFWNGLPSDARAVTGHLFSLGQGSDQLQIGGANAFPGRLVFSNDETGSQFIAGATQIPLKSWQHLVVVRRGQRVSLHLNGRLEVQGQLSLHPPASPSTWRVGIGSDMQNGLEGKIDEVAFYPRPLTPAQIANHFASARHPVAAAAPEKPPTSPRSPAQSLRSLQAPPDVEIQLAASEPLVASPVAIDWGLDGKLWVVEMPDYPYGMDGNMKPGGRIKFLEDLDGDGLYDRSTLFMDGVNFPNGIITWRKGVIVTAAPDIFYAEDTDGDGRADRKEILFTGFNEGNLQLRVNGLRWGLDNWLHCANGWSGGEPRSLLTGTKININGQDLRLRPDHGLLEPESGQSEFGRNPDDWGNWYGCDNSNPLFQFMLPQHYLRRNPHLPATDTRRQLLPQPNPRVYPRSVGQKRYHTFEHASHYTSACSSDFYRDDWLFPRETGPHLLVCEPVHNLVQHLVMRGPKSKTSLEVQLTPSGHDFLTSDDPWFRPVMARSGPDGALWVVDMYRHMIEHPDWLPPEGREELRPFYRLGENHGRIYRIVPAARAGVASRNTVPRIDSKPPVEWVALLDDSNGWLRDKAHQALLWNSDPSLVPNIESMAIHGATPFGRIHALCLLDGLDQLAEPLCLRALADPHPEVRRHAIRLSDRFAGKSDPILARLIQLAQDPDPALRLQLACSLGEWSDPRAGEALAQIALGAQGDHWLTTAVLSSSTPHLSALAAKFEAIPARDALEPTLLRLALARKRPSELANLLSPLASSRSDAVGDPAVAFTTLKRFLDMARATQTDPLLWSSDADSPMRPVWESIPSLFAQARASARSPATPHQTRLKAIALLGMEPHQLEADLTRLDALIHESATPEIRSASASALLATAHPGVPAILFRQWTTHLPAFRALALDGLLARESWAAELLDGVERGLVSPAELGASRRERLLRHRAEAVKARASKLLGAPTAVGRTEALKAYASVPTLKGDPLQGETHFARLCASCHMAHGQGGRVGPNLVTVRDQSFEKLLAAILDPTGEVEPRYLAYTCETTGGEEFYGIIASEADGAVEFKLPDGLSKTIPRAEIVRLQSSQISLMPEGLETGLTPQDMADLIAYVKYGPPNPAP